MTTYRDLLLNKYPHDRDIGHVVGCGLDKLERKLTDKEIEQAINFYLSFRVVIDTAAVSERHQALAIYINTGEVVRWIHTHWLKWDNALNTIQAEQVYSELLDLVWQMNRHLCTCLSNRREAMARFNEIQQGQEIVQRLLWGLRDKLDLRTLYVMSFTGLNVKGTFAKNEAIIKQWQTLCREIAEILGMPLIIEGQNQSVSDVSVIDWETYASLGMEYNLLEKQWLTGRQMLIKEGSKKSDKSKSSV